MGVLFSKSLRNELQHEFVGHELSAIHVAGGLAAEIRILAYNRTQQIAAGNLRNAPQRGERLRLRTLARTRRTQQREPHQLRAPLGLDPSAAHKAFVVVGQTMSLDLRNCVRQSHRGCASEVRAHFVSSGFYDAGLLPAEST